MTATHMRRRYRTASPKRGLLWLFLLVLLASLYIGQRVYSQRLSVTLDGREQKLKSMQANLETLRAERDRPLPCSVRALPGWGFTRPR